MGRFAFLILIVGLPQAHACSIPVFRYALENWAPSRYEVVLFHRGPLNATERQTARELQSATALGNYRLTECDLTGTIDAANRALWEQEGKGQNLPCLLLRYPEQVATAPSLWKGPLDAHAHRLLTQSNSRHQLHQRLTQGHAGVVLLLLSGNKEIDDAARLFLKREVPAVAQKLTLPKKSDEGPQLKSSLPLLVDFPVIEVERTADEAIFIQQLLQSEEDLDKVTGPIAFPVFGRGRALCSLHGKDLEKPGELHRALEFLCRACSCQVKELNPGIDLLIHGDWNTIFATVVAERGPMPREMPTASTRPSMNVEKPEPRTAPPAGYEAASARGGQVPVVTSPSRTKQVVVGLAIMLVIGSAVWVQRSRRAPPSNLPPNPS